jgi:hypothetical protein
LPHEKGLTATGIVADSHCIPFLVLRQRVAVKTKCTAKVAILRETAKGKTDLFRFQGDLLPIAADLSPFDTDLFPIDIWHWKIIRNFVRTIKL